MAEESLAQSDEAAAEADKGVQEHMDGEASDKEERRPLYQQARCVHLLLEPRGILSMLWHFILQRGTAVSVTSGSMIHANSDACWSAHPVDS